MLACKILILNSPTLASWDGSIILDNVDNYIYIVVMYFVTIPNRTFPPSILLREG